MFRVRLFFSALSLLFLVYSEGSRASESYFAQDFVRGLFSLSIEKPIIHTHEPKPLADGTFSNRPLKKVSLLVWNIHKGDSFGDKKLPFSLNAYDFVLLQENMWKWSLKNLPYKGKHYFVPTFSMEKEKTGISIITKHPPLKAMGYHTNYYEPFIISPKSFMTLEFENIAVINIHALNFVSFEEWASELKRISKIAKEFIHKKSGVIVAGDFNTWTEERLNTLKSEFTKIGLQEVVFKKDLRTKLLGLPLDGVYSYGFRLRDSNVFPVEEYSDHNALEVVLELKPFN